MLQKLKSVQTYYRLSLQARAFSQSNPPPQKKQFKSRQTEKKNKPSFLAQPDAKAAEKPKKAEEPQVVSNTEKAPKVQMSIEHELEHEVVPEPELIDWRVHEATINKPLEQKAVSTSQVIRDILKHRSQQDSALSLASFKEWQAAQLKRTLQGEKRQKDEFLKYLTECGFFDAVQRYPRPNADVWREYQNRADEKNRQARLDAKAKLTLAQEAYEKELEKEKEPETSLFQKDKQSFLDQPAEEKAEKVNPKLAELQAKIDQAQENYKKLRSTLASTSGWGYGMDTTGLPEACKQDAARLEAEWAELHDLQIKRLRDHVQQFNQQQQQKAIIKANLKQKLDKLAYLRTDKPLPKEIETLRKNYLKFSKSSAVPAELDAYLPKPENQLLEDAQADSRKREVEGYRDQFDDFFREDKERAHAFRLFYLHQVSQGVKHSTALQRSLEQFKSEYIFVPPTEAPDRQRLLAQSEVDASLYPYPTDKSKRLLIDPDHEEELLEELQMSGYNVPEPVEGKEIENFNEKYQKLLEKFQDVQVEVLQDYINQRSIDLAKRDDQMLGLEQPIQTQIEELTERDLKFTLSELKRLLHFDTENLTQVELAAQLVQRAALTPEQANEVAFRLKKGGEEGAPLDMQAINESFAALHGDPSNQIMSLQDLKESLLAQIPDRMSAKELSEAKVYGLKDMAIELSKQEVEQVGKEEPISGEDKLEFANKQIHLRESLLAPGQTPLIPSKPAEEPDMMVSSAEYPSETEILGRKIPSLEELQAMSEDQLSAVLETQISQEDIHDLNALISDVSEGLEAGGELHKEIERRYQKVFSDGLREMGLLKSEEPLEIARINAMLQAQSYEEVHSHIADLLQKETLNLQLEEQQARHEDIDVLETLVGDEVDPMATVHEMNDLIASQPEADHVLINAYDEQEVALYQVLNKIQDNKKLTRKDIDWIVKHLEKADPEAQLAFKAEQIGMAGSASPVYESATKQRHQDLQALKWDLFKVTQGNEWRQELQNAKGFAKIFSTEQLQAVEKLGLNDSKRFQVLCSDLESKCAQDSPILKNFGKLISGIASPNLESHQLVDQMVSLAKYNNKFGFIENHIRQLAKCLVEGGFKTQMAANNLELVLNAEVAIQRHEPEVQSATAEYPLHHNLIAQPDFAFKSAGHKLKDIEDYRNTQTQLQLTRFYRDQLESSNLSEKRNLVESLSTLQEILQKLDMGQKHDIQDLPVFHRLNQTAQMVNHQIGETFERQFGIKGITFDNIEQVYNSHVSGIPTVLKTRDYLVQNGMSDALAKKLMDRYLTKIKFSCDTYSLMDLLTKAEARKALNQAKPDQIFTNFVYQTTKDSVPSRAQTIRPTRPIPVRMFSQMFQDVRVNQSKLQMATQEEKTQNKSKFKQFVDSVEAIDEEVAKEQLAFDSQNIDIGFQGESAARRHSLLDEDDDSPFAKVSEQQQKRNEHDDLVARSKSKFDRSFFKKFTYTGKNAQQMTQKALEQHIMAMNDVEEVRMLCLSMINSAYELNDQIPNIEMLFYRMFFSPLTTKEQRKDAEDLLEGNIFCKDEINLPSQVYQSLLETMVLYPKKKHFKKLIQHLIRFNQKDQVAPELLTLICNIGIDHEYPVLMGQTMKYLLQNDYRVSAETFKTFVLFLERSRGFEEDAKRFVIMSADTTHLNIDYELLRPIFQRSIRNKTGQEVLKLFEQFRKNLKLNQSWKDKDQAERNNKLRELKCEIYDGLIQDLLSVEAHQLAQVIYTEKMKEKFDMTIGDHLTGMEIFAVQKLLPDFQAKFKEVFLTNAEGLEINLFVCEEMARMLQYFNSQDNQDARLEMMEQIYLKLRDESIKMSASLFDSLVFVYTEGQQWQSLKSLLEWANSNNCDPEQKTVQFLKKNLLYCFDSNQRAMLKEKLEAFEQEFFLGKPSGPTPTRN